MSLKVHKMQTLFELFLTIRKQRNKGELNAEEVVAGTETSIHEFNNSVRCFVV